MVVAKNYGRLGNCLFQNACAFAYAKRYGLEFTVPDTTTDPFWNPLYLSHLRNRHYNPRLTEVQINQTDGEGYREIPFKEEWRSMNITLNGYWQSFKYFEDYYKEVLDAFAFPYHQKKGWVSVHIRRGDYITLVEKHPPVSIEWYKEAMKMFPDKRFLFFSDDIQYCKDHFGDREDCLFSPHTNEVDDLVEMSCCEHHICSASTFSLWGYFLDRSTEKKAVIPKLWFQSSHSHWDTSDIVPSEIIKL